MNDSFNPDHRVTTTAHDYHRETGYFRNRMTGSALDWINQPSIYKTYSNCESIPLPQPFHFPEIDLWSLCSGKTDATKKPKPSASNVSCVLRLAYGLTSQRRLSGERFFYRSAPSAGALYPAEIYLAVRDAKGIAPGLYHFDIPHHHLTSLRQGFFTLDAPIKLKEENDRSISAIFFISGIYFRSAWKYRKRAYRYLLLDCGHVLENLFLSLEALSFSSAITFDFEDEQVCKWLGFEGEKEGLVAQVHLLGDATSTGVSVDSAPFPDPNILHAGKTSLSETVYPEIIRIHRAGFRMAPAVQVHVDMADEIGVSANHWEPIGSIQPPKDALPFSKAVVKRRSMRNFIPGVLDRSVFLSLLNLVIWASGRHHRTEPEYSSTVALGFIVNAVDGFESGFYIIDAIKKRIGRISSGSYSKRVASVCLDQEWLSSASICFLFMANLHTIDRIWGARGYRYAMIIAGQIGQVIYLGATALGLGACGIGAFYDQEARELLGLNSSSGLLYLVASGLIRKPIDRIMI